MHTAHRLSYTHLRIIGTRSGENSWELSEISDFPKITAFSGTGIPNGVHCASSPPMLVSKRGNVVGKWGLMAARRIQLQGIRQRHRWRWQTPAMPAVLGAGNAS